MKNRVNITTPKETSKASITDPKELEIYVLLDEKFQNNLLKGV